MESLTNKWTLVTGASSGFGIQFARILAARQSNLVLVARRTEPMEQLAAELRQSNPIKVLVEGMDLAQPGAAAELASRLKKRGISIDILINNAGYGRYGSFIDQPVEGTVDMMRLNMVAVAELTHIFAAEMVGRRSGHILLIASLLGYQAVPGYAVYAATKAYVLLFGEALHNELKPHGVSVTTLCPGPSATSFGEVAGQKSSFFLRVLTMKPVRVAEAGIAAMLKRKVTVVPGILGKAIVFSDRLMPRSMQRLIFERVLAG